MLELAPGTVHLWARDLDRDVDTLDLSLLNAEEAARAARFRFDHHRRRFITHRAWLRRVLALYLDMPPHARHILEWFVTSGAYKSMFL